MKMSALSHAAVNSLTLVSLRLEPSEVPPRHHYKMCPLPVERFVYIKKGSARFRLQDREIPVESKDMLYLPAGASYESVWKEASCFVVMDILLHDAGGQPIHFDEEASVLLHDKHGIYEGLLTELGEKATADGPFDWLERLSMTFRLLCNMARDINREETARHHKVIDAGMQYLENNLSNDASVEYLASLCSVSAGSFRRSFVAHTGMSPVEYRNRLRVRKAADLLKTGEYTVSEVAEQVGIHDLKYFGKLFRRYIGLSPREFKKTVEG